MPASIQHESGNLFRVRVSDVLRQAELKDVQAVAAREIARLGTITLLFVLEQFEGWEWDARCDLEFYEAHDKDIDKIAIIGDEKRARPWLGVCGRGDTQGGRAIFLPGGERPGARLALGG